jgi:hypothetical protein
MSRIAASCTEAVEQLYRQHFPWLQNLPDFSCKLIPAIIRIFKVFKRHVGEIPGVSIRQAGLTEDRVLVEDRELAALLDLRRDLE